jgi:hypothetical protein
MALDRFINVTLDANASKKPDRVDHRHEPRLGASASADVSVAFDTAKITSMSLLKSAIDAALQQAAGMLRP